jgi:hypothetical protein
LVWELVPGTNPESEIGARHHSFNSGVTLTPPLVDNVQFVSNLTPQGPLTPGDGGSLVFANAGFEPDILALLQHWGLCP